MCVNMLVYIKFLSNMWDFFFLKKKTYNVEFWFANHSCKSISSRKLSNKIPPPHRLFTLQYPQLACRRPDPSRPWGWGFRWGWKTAELIMLGDSVGSFGKKKNRAQLGYPAGRINRLPFSSHSHGRETWGPGRCVTCLQNGLFYTSIYYGRKGITYTIKVLVGCLHPVNR